MPRYVSEQEFNDIMSNSIKLEKCPKCKIGAGDIIIRMPLYGKTGVCIKCPYCGHETKTYGITEMVFCETKIGTPFTEKAIMRGILKAVAERNRGE